MKIKFPILIMTFSVFFVASCSLEKNSQTSYSYDGANHSQENPKTENFFINYFYEEEAGVAFCVDCPPTKVHFWTEIDDSSPFEKYSTYTYILAPHTLFDEGENEKLNETLVALNELVGLRADDEMNGSLNKYANVFLIPVNESNEYSGELARDFAQSIITSIGLTDSDNVGLPRITSGPILISINVPHFELKEGDPLLWFDMSSVPSDSIKQFIEEYMKKIQNNPIKSQDEFISVASQFIVAISRFKESLNETVAWVKNVKNVLAMD